MNLKTYDEMDVSHRMAYDMGLQAAVDQAAEPDIEAAVEIGEQWITAKVEAGEAGNTTGLEMVRVIVAAALGTPNE